MYSADYNIVSSAWAISGISQYVIIGGVANVEGYTNLTMYSGGGSSTTNANFICIGIADDGTPSVKGYARETSGCGVNISGCKYAFFAMTYRYNYTSSVRLT